MPTITICDITVTKRAVELPDECPKCKTKLRESSLTAWEYQDQSRGVTIDDAGNVGTDGGDYSCDDLPQGGESFISWVALTCGGCGYMLAEGKVHAAPPTAKS